jgi:hypothetical protein
MTNALKDEDEMSIMSMEAIMTIICVQPRKTAIRERLLNRMSDEKGVSLDGSKKSHFIL